MNYIRGTLQPLLFDQLQIAKQDLPVAAEHSQVYTIFDYQMLTWT